MRGLRPHRAAALLTAATVLLVSGCSDESERASTTGKPVGGQLDESDPDHVYAWARAACRDAPLHMLARSVGADQDPDAIVAAIGTTFPRETADAATAGCEAGFKLRSRERRSEPPR